MSRSCPASFIQNQSGHLHARVGGKLLGKVGSSSLTLSATMAIMKFLDMAIGLVMILEFQYVSAKYRCSMLPSFR